MKPRFHQFHLYCQHKAEISNLIFDCILLRVVHWTPTENKTFSIETNLYFSQFLFPLYCFSYVACSTNTPLPLPSISMVAERTCRSIWLIIFTLPAEAGLSWGYLHLSHLSFFVRFNSSSYYPTNHLFFFICTQVAKHILYIHS